MAAGINHNDPHTLRYECSLMNRLSRRHKDREGKRSILARETSRTEFVSVVFIGSCVSVLSLK